MSASEVRPTGAMPSGSGEPAFPAPAASAEAIAREANRRIGELGWRVVVQVDRDGRGEERLALRRVRTPGLPPDSTDPGVPVTVRSTSSETVADLFAAIRARGWDLDGATPLRLARSSIWCEPV